MFVRPFPMGSGFRRLQEAAFTVLLILALAVPSVAGQATFWSEEERLAVVVDIDRVKTPRGLREDVTLWLPSDPTVRAYEEALIVVNPSVSVEGGSGQLADLAASVALHPLEVGEVLLATLQAEFEEGERFPNRTRRYRVQRLLLTRESFIRRLERLARESAWKRDIPTSNGQLAPARAVAE